MALNKLFYIYIFLTYILVTAAFTTPKMNKKKCLVKDNMITSIIKISLKQCVQECKMRIACLSLNYRRLHLLCELFSIRDGTFVTNSGKTGPCVHILRSDISESEEQTCLPESGSCEAKECPNLEIPNAVLEGNMRTIGARVLVKCARYWYVEETGRTSIQCQPNGTWDYEPKCVSSYKGCYEDDCSRKLMPFDRKDDDDQMTIEICIDHCSAYNYAAPQHRNACFCGNTLDENLARQETECNTECTGNSSQTCGGSFHGSVYKLK